MDVAVEFLAVDEFLEELERDAVPGGDRVIVRNVVRIRIEHHVALGIRRIIVRCSYVSDQAVIGIRRNIQLVELREFAGSQWGGPEDERWGGPEDERTQERVESIEHAIRQACERLGIEIRHGAHRAVAS